MIGIGCVLGVVDFEYVGGIVEVIDGYGMVGDECGFVGGIFGVCVG